jgi:hypothetical protein
MKRIAALFLMITGAAACSLIELPVEVAPAERTLVISSLMLGRTGMVVTVTRSFSPLDGRDVESLGEEFIETLLVRNGRVTLSGPTFYDTLGGGRDVPGFYAGFTPDIQNGDSLHVAVFDSVTGLTCRASTRLMPPVQPDSTRRDSVAVFDTWVHEMELWFTDPEEPNWYALHLYKASDVFFPADSTVFFGGNERVVSASHFSDRSAANAVVRRKITFDERVTSADTLVAVLSNVEEGYFRFLDARIRSGGLVSSLFSEPLNYPDNVENGYGYFSAHQPRALVIYPDNRTKKVKVGIKRIGMKPAE